MAQKTKSATPPPNQFEVRAFYIDCRAEVMTMDAIKALATDLSKKGINTMLIEWEATFPFDKHATLCNQYAFSAAQVNDLVAHCAKLGIEIIPLQNCFGHCEYILRHNRYWGLRENSKDPSQVCPLKVREAVPIFTEIFREVAALHPSKYFHIGGDETYLLGSCKECMVVTEKEGKSRLFVDYVKAMSKIVIDMGKTPVIWADIILKYPEALAELPRELIFVDWNYGWEPNRFGNLENLFEAGVKMWGASSLRSSPDNQYLTQWEKHFNNLTVFIPFARKAGYTGMIQTSWSTGGTYGFHYDTGHEIINMQPIRQVYPMSGFNVLIDAYCQAVNSNEPVNGHKFAVDYAKAKYGFNPSQAEILWEYFTMPQEVIRRDSKDNNGTPIGKVLDDCIAMKAKIDGLAPTQNKEEFAHYGLMLDIRINYLKFKQIEGIYQSPSYNRSQAPALIVRMQEIIDQADVLNQRFFALNHGYLKNGELLYMNSIRNEKMKALYGWLLNNEK